MAEPNHQAPNSTDPPLDCNLLVAKSLARAGVDRMFGVVGIPVTSLANRAVQLGIPSYLHLHHFQFMNSSIIRYHDSYLPNYFTFNL